MAQYGTWMGILCPTDPTVYIKLEKATIYTRIHTYSNLADLGRIIANTPAVSNTFCFVHHNNLLIFDGDEESHRQHVRIVLEMLLANGMRSDVDGCEFDMESLELAGFILQGKEEDRLLLVAELVTREEAHHEERIAAAAAAEAEARAQTHAQSQAQIPKGDHERADVTDGYVVPKQGGSKRTGKKNKKDRKGRN